jgi:RNA polymerase-binding transcription factor DksA
VGYIDDAQASEQQDRDRALQRVRDRIDESRAPRNAAIDGTCIDCNEPIESERLAVIKTSRCASCAHDFEHRNRGFR